MKWFLLFIVCTGFTAPLQEAGTIAWSDTRRLTWADFKGSPDLASGNAALTSAKITFRYGYSGPENFIWTIECTFDKNRSWGKIKNNLILSHEQGHFDITEIHARLLQKGMKEYKFKEGNVAKEVQAIYQKVTDAQNVMQTTYDAETNFSRNPDEQKRWLEKIKKQLEELKPYADYNKKASL